MTQAAITGSSEIGVDSSIKILAAISLASLPFLALFGDSRSLTFDEIYSVTVSSLTAADILKECASDVHPPLYYLLLAGWIKLFGASELAARSLSGALFVACTFSVYGLARQVWDRRTGLISAVVFMTSPIALLHAQFARMYTLAALFSILSTWFFTKLFFKDSKAKRDLALYALVNILGSFTHVWFFFVLFAEIIAFLLLTTRARLKLFALALALSVAPYAVLWLPVLINQYATARNGLSWLDRPGLFELAYVAAWIGGAAWIAIGLLALLFIFGNKYRARLRAALAEASRLKREPAVLFAAMFSVALIVPFLISFKSPIFHVRYTIVAAHFFALVAGWLLARLTGQRLLLLSGLMMLAASLLITTYVAIAPDYCSDRSTASYIAGQAEPDDVIVYTHLSRLPVEYYLNRADKSFASLSFPPNNSYLHQGFLDKRRLDLDREAQRITESIDSLLDEKPRRRVWVLGGYDDELDKILKDSLDSRFRFEQEIGLQCEKKVRGFTLYDRLMIYSRAAE